MCKINWNREFGRVELMLKFYATLVITLRPFVNKILIVLIELEALDSEIYGRSSCIFFMLNKAIWLSWFNLVCCYKGNDKVELQLHSIFFIGCKF